MLNGEIQVMAELWFFFEYFNKLFCDFFRVAVLDAYPSEGFDFT